jgi:hypothetical protein
MVAVRNLLSTLNNLAQTGLVASGWPRLAEQDAAVGPGDGTVREAPPQPWWEGAYVEGGVEPPLEEVLGDPLIHLMMRADRLEPEQVRRLLTSGQGHAEP